MIELKEGDLWVGGVLYRREQVTIVNPDIKAYDKEIKALRRQVRVLRRALQRASGMLDDRYWRDYDKFQRLLRLTTPKEEKHEV